MVFGVYDVSLERIENYKQKTADYIQYLTQLKEDSKLSLSELPFSWEDFEEDHIALRFVAQNLSADSILSDKFFDNLITKYVQVYRNLEIILTGKINKMVLLDEAFKPFTFDAESVVTFRRNRVVNISGISS